MSDSITKIKEKSKITKQIASFRTDYDPEGIFTRLKPKLNNIKAEMIKQGRWQAEVNSDFFRALSLTEFQNGHLLTIILPEQYKAFGIDLLRKIQDEYNCKKVSEQATAELAVLSFIRVLELQRKINGYLERAELNGMDMTYFGLLSKELDRANRQYFTAVQTLKMAKQQPIKVSVKSNTTIIGQNQLVQENQHVNNPI